MLALPPLGHGESGESIIFSGLAPCRRLIEVVEAAGHAFFDEYERTLDVPTHGEERNSCDEPDCAVNEKQGKKKKSIKKESEDALKLSKLLKDEDLYGLLELDAGASQEDLRKAHRRLCLIHHPDKQGVDVTEEQREAINVKFLKIQEAFDILNDPKKRRKYDSIGDFDDSVPSCLKEGHDFFLAFGTVFKRNAKWSEVKPVPDVGDAGTPYDEVRRFYEFWHSFESWRDLDGKIMEECGEDCFMNLDEAECREEKRWMERENSKLRQKFQKVERQRILKLVEVAERHDPRIKAEKDRLWQLRESEKLEKEAKKQLAEKQRREEEEKRIAEMKRLEEDRRAEKARKDEERQTRKLARAKLRKQMKEMNVRIVDSQLQEFLLILNSEEVDSLSAKLAGSTANGDVILSAMREKGIQVIVAKAEEDRSTTEGSAASERGVEEEEEVDPKEIERQEQERELRAAAQRQKEDELRKVREAEAEMRAAEKKERDAKKKLELEKRDVERKKIEKKEEERLKKQEAKKKKDDEVMVEKARQEIEENKKRGEEQRMKAQQEKEMLEQERAQEMLQQQFERNRHGLADQFDAMDWQSVVDAAHATVKQSDIEICLAIASRIENSEEKVDAQLACLGNVFVLGVRADQQAPTLSSTLRGRIKKIRMKLRSAMESCELLPSVNCTREKQFSIESKKFKHLLQFAAGVPEALKIEELKAAVRHKVTLLKNGSSTIKCTGKCKIFEKENMTVIGEVQVGQELKTTSNIVEHVDDCTLVAIHPKGIVNVAMFDVLQSKCEQADKNSGNGKKDAKSKIRKDDDIDALLAEFGEETSNKKKEKKNKKK